MLRAVPASFRFDHVWPVVVDRARILPVPFLTPGTSGMTLGSLILMRRSRLDDKQLLAHELVHVEQYQRYGWIGFLARYLSAYVAGLVRLRSHRQAYEAIPFEVEARERAREFMTAA